MLPRPARPPCTPPRTPRAWALAGLVLGADAALLCFAPARWLGQALEHASAGQLRLEQARGTLWRGSAQLVLTGGAQSQDSSALPGRVHWHLTAQFTGARAQLHLDCCTSASQPLQLQAHARWGGVQVQLADHQSQWPAAVLAGLGTPWNTLAPQGRLHLSTRDLALSWAQGRMQMTGSTQLDALDISSRLSTLHPMGSYRLQVHGGPAPTLTLQTLQGHLLLSGSGQWVGQRLRFQGQAQAREGDEAQLSNLLNIIGRRVGAQSLITLG